LIVVAEAPPLIVLLAARTCLISRIVESLAPIATASASKTSLRERVKVPALAAVLVTTMLVTTVEVAEGTVYKVVEVVVVAAPRNKFFGVDGIR
jgi:nitrate/nitrite transporter NarK